MNCTFFRGPKLCSRIVLLLPLLSVGCFSSYNREFEESFAAHHSSKATAHEAAASEESPKAQPINDAELLEFIVRYAEPLNSWNPEAAETFATLNTYETRTKLQEAALVVGLLRIYLQEQPKGTRLRDLANTSGLNLATAFTNNSYLKTYEIFELCLRAITLARPEDGDYVQQIETPVRNTLERWQTLGTKLHAPVAEGGGQAPADAPVVIQELPNKIPTPPPEVDQANTQSPGEVAPALPYNSDVFVADEALLREAQTLIDQASFQEALKRLGSFKPDSPYYAAAQEKARNAKNLAVQDLRKKAATAFQSSMPVSDPKAKGAYLNEAQSYLEQAISQYPDADHIETVKQNLSVIKKHLADLEATQKKKRVSGS